MPELNIDDVVTEVRLDTRVSKKTNREYSVLVIKLDNGYEWESFIDKPVQYMITSLMTGKK